jgi:ketosteroid isomerase-like protein
MSRSDFELMLLRYTADIDVNFDPEFAALGQGGTFRGHGGMLEMLEAFMEAWKWWETVPEIVIDLGDRVLVLGRIRLSGNASGMELESEVGQLLTLRGGLIAHEQEFLAWDQGLRAAGLDPDANAVLSLAKAVPAARGDG